MAYLLKGTALWRKSNVEQQQVVKLIPKYATILRKHRPELCQIVEPEDLWVYLQKYDVLNEAIRHRMMINATREEMVDRLLQHIERGPTWRLHALLRSCCITHQDHVVNHIGLNPDDYSGPSPPDSDEEDASHPLPDIYLHHPTPEVLSTSETASPSPPGQQSKNPSPHLGDVSLPQTTLEVQSTSETRHLSQSSPGQQITMDTTPCSQTPTVEDDIENMEELEPILIALRDSTNRKLEISEVLDLVGDETLLSKGVLKTFENFYIKRITGGRGVPLQECDNFYNFCLFAGLADLKGFTEEHLQKFNISQSAYRAFLKRTEVEESGRNVTYFEPDVLHHFFAARAIERLPEEKRNAILLYVCANSNPEPVHKFVFDLLGEYANDKYMSLLIDMTRLLLLTEAIEVDSDLKAGNQSKEWFAFQSNLKKYQQSITNAIPSAEVLLFGQDTVNLLDAASIAAMWQMVGILFCQLTLLTKRNQSPFGKNYWSNKYFSFKEQNRSFLHKYIPELLGDCTEEQQSEIAQKTYMRMLPCNSVYPCGTMGWVNVGSNYISCLSPRDLPESLKKHRETVPERVTTDKVVLDFSHAPSHWSYLADSDKSWDCAIWDRALQAVSTSYCIVGTLFIDLPEVYIIPLTGLLYSITHLDRSDYPGSKIYIQFGDISLEELRDWYLVSGDTHRRNIELWHTTIYLPGDKQEREEVLQWVVAGFSQDVNRHIVYSGQTEGDLHTSYRIADLTFIKPGIAFI